ncbi:DUF3320 domain-containing protein [Glutamicibacter sp. AGC46]
MSNVHVQQAMNLLSSGLNEFITAKLQPILGPLEWPSVLSELDSLKGKEGWTYSRTDVALQLRMLTERLGNLGYPFDAGDKNRTLSSYGSVLRIVRRRWAHNDEFGTFDALNAVDTVRTVLAHIGNQDRADQATVLRNSLVSELVESPTDRSSAEETSENSVVSKKDAGGRGTSETQPAGNATLTGAVPWEPWNVAVVGEQEDLDSLRPARVKEMVRSLIEDVVESEGPIHKDRLAKLVGYGFGFTRVSAARKKRILNQVTHAAVAVDQHGFVWSEGIDVTKWLIHRTSTEAQRRFEDICPVEIANAAAAVIQSQGQMSAEQLRQKVLEQFGRKIKSKGSEFQMDLGISYAISQGMIPAGS